MDHQLLRTLSRWGKAYDNLHGLIGGRVGGVEFNKRRSGKQDALPSTSDNLFDMHPPFQIDGNFGGTAGIAEMLVQSHAGHVHLLPAIPKNWAEGKAIGLRARGDLELDIEWAEGALTAVTLRAGPNYKPMPISFDGKRLMTELRPGEQKAIAY